MTTTTVTADQLAHILSAMVEIADAGEDMPITIRLETTDDDRILALTHEDECDILTTAAAVAPAQTPGDPFVVHLELAAARTVLAALSEQADACVDEAPVSLTLAKDGPHMVLQMAIEDIWVLSVGVEHGQPDGGTTWRERITAAAHAAPVPGLAGLNNHQTRVIAALGRYGGGGIDTTLRESDQVGTAYLVVSGRTVCAAITVDHDTPFGGALATSL